VGIVTKKKVSSEHQRRNSPFEKKGRGPKSRVTGPNLKLELKDQASL